MQPLKYTTMRFVKKLNFHDKVNLSELMRTGENHNVRKRAHAILLSDKKYKIEEISNIFEVDRDTVCNWFNRWESEGMSGLEDKPRSGRPRKETIRS